MTPSPSTPRHNWCRNFQPSGVGESSSPTATTCASTLLRHFHDNPLAGHLGAQRTLSRIRRAFVWPRMATDVEEYIRSCPSCQTTKPSNQKPAGLLQPHPPPPHLWHTVTLDLITQLPRTKLRHDAIVVFVDHLTKVAHFSATTTTVTAPLLARLFMHEVVRLHGVPRVLLSDRDPRFTGAFWRELWQFFGMDCRFSTAYHPQTDGLTERTNRTLEQILRAYVSPTHRDWDLYLDTAEFAYNTAYNDTIKCAPFELLYGSPPRHPLQLVQPSPPSSAPSAAAVASTLQQRLDAARQAIHKAQQHQKQQADKKRRDVSYNVGDVVLLNTINLPITSGVRKFQPRWIGPFPITQKISHTAYRLQLPPSLRVHNVFHVNLLKPFHGGPAWCATPPTADAEPRASYANFSEEVSRILETRRLQRHNQRVRQYLVQWTGREEHDATWVDEQQIREARSALETFWRQHNTTFQSPRTTTPKGGAECNPAPTPRRSNRTRRQTTRARESEQQRRSRNRRS